VCYNLDCNKKNPGATILSYAMFYSPWVEFEICERGVLQTFQH